MALLFPTLLTTFSLYFLRNTRFFLNGVYCSLCFRLSYVLFTWLSPSFFRSQLSWERLPRIIYLLIFCLPNHTAVPWEQGVWLSLITMYQVPLQCLTHERNLINIYGINIDTFIMALISYYSWLCLGLFPLLHCELLKSRDFFSFVLPFLAPFMVCGTCLVLIRWFF